MTDHELFESGVAAAKKLYFALSQDMREQLACLTAQLEQDKVAIAGTLHAADSAVRCRACRGQCCLNGKFRISMLDMLVHVSRNETIPVPDFTRKPLCPYGDDNGCLMPPRLRPLDCVVFICEQIEGQLGEPDRIEQSALEKQLRATVCKAEALLGHPVGRSLLLSAEH